MDILKRKKVNSIYLDGLAAFLVIGFLEIVWPSLIPFKLFQFWFFKGSLREVITHSWPVLAWAFGNTVYLSLVRKNPKELNRRADELLEFGFYASLKAGITEELLFRWIFFFRSMLILQVLNIVFFGFLGWGVFEWLHTTVLGPVTNFVTLGILESTLLKTEWVVGFGLIVSNYLFMEGHSYQGLKGWIVSWMMGLFLFHLLFTYGLFAAILIHFLIDFLIFSLVYLDACLEKALGNT